MDKKTKSVSMKKIMLFMLFVAVFLAGCGLVPTDAPVAHEEYLTYNDYLNYAEKIETEPVQTLEPTATPEIGGIIEFGGHRWLVLDVEDYKALIITEQIVDRRMYHSSLGIDQSVTWEESDIRHWLNDEFYNNFTPNEKIKMLEHLVINNDNPWTGSNGGNDTTDKIFLLSVEEVVKYFGDNGMLDNIPSNLFDLPEIADPYRYARIAYNADGLALGWWLRSPGINNRDAAKVTQYGRIDYFGEWVNFQHQSNGIRPALWLNLLVYNYYLMCEDYLSYAEETETEPVPAYTTTPMERTSFIPEIGDIIEFGGHNWLVLDVHNYKALIITERSIAQRQYHTVGGIGTSIIWEHSDIRRWLNNDFYNTFTASEQRRIIEMLVMNNNNPWHGTFGGHDTYDKIFLLSVEEAVKYFGNGDLLNNSWGVSDEYDFTRIAFNEYGDAIWWWLRTPGDAGRFATNVWVTGSISGGGYFVNFGLGSVRPAMWLNLLYK